MSKTKHESGAEFDAESAGTQPAAGTLCGDREALALRILEVTDQHVGPEVDDVRKAAADVLLAALQAK